MRQWEIGGTGTPNLEDVSRAWSASLSSSKFSRKTNLRSGCGDEGFRQIINLSFQSSPGSTVDKRSLRTDDGRT